MRKTSLGIRSQLTAGIVIMTLAGIGLIGLLSIKIVENSAVFWKISEAETMVRLLKAETRLLTEEGSPARALSHAGASLKEAGIKSFRITGPSGELVSGEGRSGPAGERLSYPGEIEVWRIGGSWFKGPGDSLQIRAPLELVQGRGALEFTLPLTGIREEINVARKFLFLYAVLDSVIIIAFGVYFLSRSIVSPLKRLEEAATRIAGGKLFERAQVSVDNEVGSLADSFNRMAERLEEEIKSLERVNIELTGAQEELLRSSTLAAVGRLAAGIAHEIGNPLGALSGYIDIIGRGGVSKEEEKEILERASREVSRIDAIVREFLDIARPSKRAVKRVDVNSVVSESLTTAAVLKDFNGVETASILSEGLPGVMIDEGKLRQVFMNLLINAAHSMDGVNGRRAVTVSTRTEKRAVERRGRRRGDPPIEAAVSVVKDFVHVDFADTGKGISEEDSRKVFEPFFSTKEVGRGSGLGLFVSQSIIRAYGGEITLESRPGRGSTFTVTLPAGETR